eukprot:gene11788-8099_t
MTESSTMKENANIYNAVQRSDSFGNTSREKQKKIQPTCRAPQQYNNIGPQIHQGVLSLHLLCLLLFHIVALLQRKIRVDKLEHYSAHHSEAQKKKEKKSSVPFLFLNQL